MRFEHEIKHKEQYIEIISTSNLFGLFHFQKLLFMIITGLKVYF